MITLKVDSARFQRDVNRFMKSGAGSDANFRTLISAATNKMLKLAKMKVRNYTSGSKVKSGYLINHIIQQITNKGMTGRVTSHASYSQAFEEGTRPHTIRAKMKRVLAGPKRGAPAGWDISPKSASIGYAVYGTKVQHPGTNPHPFMYPAWRFACDYFEKLIDKALS